MCFTSLLYYVLRDSFSSHQELSSSFDPRTKQRVSFPHIEPSLWSLGEGRWGSEKHTNPKKILKTKLIVILVKMKNLEISSGKRKDRANSYQGVVNNCFLGETEEATMRRRDVILHAVWKVGTWVTAGSFPELGRVGYCITFAYFIVGSIQ